MNSTRSEWLALASMGTVVLFQTWFLLFRLWREPLKHGPSHFLGVAVGPGFYEGPGSRWLRGYHWAIVLQYLILLGGFLLLVIEGRWTTLPILAPVHVVSFFALVGGFTLWTRWKLNRNPPVLERVAIDLSPRTTTVSWALEVLMFTLLGASWLELTANDLQFGLLMTWAVAGLLPFKLLALRRTPLPAENVEAYRRLAEAASRHGVRIIDSIRWMLLSILASIALFRAFPTLRQLPGALAVAAAPAIAVWVFMMVQLMRGSGQLNRLGAGLRPTGSWTSPFRRRSIAHLVCSVVFTVGLVALLLWPRLR